MAFQYREGQHTYDELKQTVISEETHSPSLPVPATEEEIPQPVETAAAPECTLEDKISVPLNVDFDLLIGQNPDTVGWVYIEGTHINYPVLQGEDNRHYVSTLFDGSFNQAGSIFMDYRNSPRMDDVHTILYGHNMRDKSMFADILNYQQQEYYDAHPTGFYITPEKSYSFEVIAAYVASLADPAWQLDFVTEEELVSWVQDAMSRSAFQSRIQPQPGDKVITLSTCSYEFDEARFVLVGILKKI